MNYEQPLIERRQHVRVSARGAVILRGRGREIHGRGVVVDDTCLEVRCQLGFALFSMAGAFVEVEMRLDGATGTWFATRGRVSRVRAGDHSLVIELRTLPEPLVARLADEAARLRVAPIEVMVVDGDRARRTQVSKVFRAEGCHVVEAGTTLEALDSLTGAVFATDVITVADTTPESVGVDLCDYLDIAHASALVVGVGDPEWTPTRTRLDPSDSESLLRGRVKSLLQASAVRRE